MKSACVLKIEDVSKTYKSSDSQSVKILDSIKFEMGHSECVALIGKSGSGKTTLLNIIAGFDTPDSGSVYIDSVDISSLSHDNKCKLRVTKLGVVFQFFNLLPTLSLSENILVPGYISHMKRPDASLRLQEVLNLVGLSKNVAQRLPHEVSGGEAQRAAIARALFNKPQLILADEPTGNLDTKTTEHILHLFKELTESEACSLLLVTHDKDTERIAHRVIRMQDGTLL